MFAKIFRLLNIKLLLAGLILGSQIFLGLNASTVSAVKLIPDVIDQNKSPDNELPRYNAGVQQSIEDYLCTPTGLGTDLFDCVGRLYRFSIAFGAIAVIFFIVLAGYYYITGGETGKKKGKDIIFSSITGMAIIIFSFVLLRFINPALTEIRPIQTPIFKNVGLPKCEDIGFGANCVISQGPGAGQVFNAGVAGSASEAQYKDLITKYAGQNNIEYCALSALIQKESTFNRYAKSNPAGSVDPKQPAPSHGVTWADYHAIGLTQITIYPKNHEYGSWAGNLPSRVDKASFGTSEPLTVSILIDPENSIKYGSHFFGILMKERKNNLRSGYDDYQAGRGGNSDPATLNKYMDMYNACKKRG